ncbi:hypothetical protein ABUW04_39265 [Streptacidiphilus sp. N1-10]|uniref:Integral membrane protein n=1 Tax=Streptacidiphilus jeojiensis TaxID=3229225 RepID=A0ABV6Y197_9ACTN
MNLDFSAQPLFSWYVVLLAVSGVAMVALAAARSGSTGMRVFNALVGVAFLGYAIYLAFIFEGGTYFIMFKAFILPVLLIANGIKSIAARRQATEAAVRAQQVQAQQILAARAQAAQEQAAAPAGTGAPVTPQA